MKELDNICFFSKKVQVKLKLLENFEFKNLSKKVKGLSLEKVKFLRPSVLKRVVEV